LNTVLHITGQTPKKSGLFRNLFRFNRCVMTRMMAEAFENRKEYSDKYEKELKKKGQKKLLCP